jgi:histidine kinase family protein
MLEPMQKLIKEKYLNIQAKLVFPLAVTILLLVVVLSPLTNRLINSRIEQEADRRLSEIANSIGALIANSETLVRNHAALLANQPEVEGAFLDLGTYSDLLARNKTTLNLQELSLYKADFKPGDQAYYYGGPPVTRRLQASADADRIREELIRKAIDGQVAVSSVAITPQNSQIIGAAPVHDPTSQKIVGVVLTAFYMDQNYIDNISTIINTKVAIVKDNAVIASTIDKAADYERLINEGWLNSTTTPSTDVTFADQEQYRLLGEPLIISGSQQGFVLVAQPIENLFAVSRGNWCLWPHGLVVLGGCIPGFYPPSRTVDSSHHEYEQGRFKSKSEHLVFIVQG